MSTGTDTTSIPTTEIPARGVIGNHRYRMFEVPPEIFKRFDVGRNKFERWSKYLDLQDETQHDLYKYARRYPTDIILLKCTETGALRSIKRRSSVGL